MKSNKEIGDRAEKLVCSRISCPCCKRGKLHRLRTNFECADVICSFCGYVAQVKAHKMTDPEDESITKQPGATWKSQKERIEAGIYHPIYVVLYFRDRPVKILCLSAEFQLSEMFRPPRKPPRDRQLFDYCFGWETRRFSVPVWERTPTEDDHGRIRLTEVAEASFSQLPQKKNWRTPP